MVDRMFLMESFCDLKMPDSGPANFDSTPKIGEIVEQNALLLAGPGMQTSELQHTATN